MKKLTYFLTTAVCLAIAPAFGQANEKEKTSTTDVIAVKELPKTVSLNSPLIIVDGKETDQKTFEAIDQSKVEAVHILKDANAVAAYGDKGKYGVIVVKMKPKK
ncbi:hypothetical protein [Flavobacterium sp.]|uniref:hypothetical protein n=1 Tax=Flavobacterium sp. TaxID=239 RepID=UPI0012032604|nr:hypothetical protein [Flavobacterium sp.]RZJ71289.1 MAG: hypothetical protein EOO49_11110 [Flavobacterium sp.]